MVRTDQNLDNMPPEERKKVIAQIKAEKEKELDQLIKQKEEEMAQASHELAQAEEELSEEDEEHNSNSQTLEETVQDAPEEEGEHITYTPPLEQMIPQSLYEFTDYNVYQELKGIQKTIQDKGYATNDQQARLKEFREQRDIIKHAYTTQEMNTANESRGQYLSRAESILKDIDDKLYKGT